VNKLSDAVLLEELKMRFNENKKALHDLRVMTKKLEQVNRKLQDSEAMKSNFLSNIRNEIVNPLTSIMGLSEQIFTGVMGDDESTSMAKMIFAEAFKLDFQLKNIFLAAELEAGESTVSVAQVDIDTLIKNLIASFENNVREKNLLIEYNCHGSPKERDGLYFKTDPEKFKAILQNLLANAIEFSLDNNKVLITIRAEGKRLLCDVQDWGIGISNDQREKIFDRFRQLDSGVRKSHRGHGLGLSIVKALIERLEGDLDFVSVVGKGSTFSFSIPESTTIEVAAFSEEGNEFIFDIEEDAETREI
jgi:signal transduction histidine kinase